jgi:glycosyltransferase involved in cell wall biosynthesis
MDPTNPTGNILFSVIIPVYNRSELVKEAIDSVLSQSFRNFELIVVDDGSTDDTPGVLAEYGDRLKLITQENAGPESARNNGAGAARGEYLAFLDSDDVMLPRALGVYERIIAAVGGPALIMAGMFHFRGGEPIPGGNGVTDVEFVTYKDYFSKDRPVYKSSSIMTVRKDVFEMAGCFRHAPDRTYPCDDGDFILRAGIYGPAVLVLQPVTVGYRIHEGNVTGDMRRITQSIQALISSEKKGVYPGGRSRMLDRYAVIGGMVLAMSKSALLQGCFGAGLRLFARGFPMVLAGAFRKALIGLKGRKPSVAVKIG